MLHTGWALVSMLFVGAVFIAFAVDELRDDHEVRGADTRALVTEVDVARYLPAPRFAAYGGYPRTIKGGREASPGGQRVFHGYEEGPYGGPASVHLACEVRVWAGLPDAKAWVAERGVTLVEELPEGLTALAMPPLAVEADEARHWMLVAGSVPQGHLVLVRRGRRALAWQLRGAVVGGPAKVAELVGAKLAALDAFGK